MKKKGLIASVMLVAAVGFASAMEQQQIEQLLEPQRECETELHELLNKPLDQRTWAYGMHLRAVMIRNLKLLQLSAVKKLPPLRARMTEYRNQLLSYPLNKKQRSDLNSRLELVSKESEAILNHAGLLNEEIQNLLVSDICQY